jgi:peptide-methionine (S)-S-oxide reductase
VIFRLYVFNHIECAEELMNGKNMAEGASVGKAPSRAALTARVALLAALVALVAFGCVGIEAALAEPMVTAASFPAPPAEAASPAGSVERAVLAGGCFWGMQGVFERLKGVESTTVGYSGGSARTAHYDIVSTGTTGHAETLELTFDPAVISFGTLLEVFFTVAMNPTELNFQGPDYGTQYRSVVFATSPEQKRIAEEYIAKINASKVFPEPIVTQVVPFKSFYAAESYHQHFLDKNPDNPYIAEVDMPKIAELKRIYPGLVSPRTMF